MRRLVAFAIVPAAFMLVAAAELKPADYAADARSIETIVNAQYAYLDRFAGGRMPMTDKLRAEASAVSTPRELVRYSERALALLADHHAITGSSTKESWAVVPSYSDLWIERKGPDYVIEQVRADTPASQVGIRAGDRLVSIGGVPTAAAVSAFWADLGATGGGDRDGYAARVLAAGRRDRQRELVVQSDGAAPRAVVLPNLYYRDLLDRPVLTGSEEGKNFVIRIHDSLGNSATVPAFDRVMARSNPGQRVVIDLTDTPGGGNTTVARAMLGWFVDKPTFYQIHRLPVEERDTGIARQWVEQVLPRAGKRHRGPVTVRVGRWTGSMGEGLAIGFNAIGARVEGSRMAGLLGAIYDHRLERSGQVIKIPTERLYAVDGTPREQFVPKRGQ